MSLNSLTNDSCSYQEKLRRSVGPGMYMLNTPASDIYECSQDIPADPSLRFQTFGPNTCVPGKAIDDSSELEFVDGEVPIVINDHESDTVPDGMGGGDMNGIMSMIMNMLSTNSSKS